MVADSLSRSAPLESEWSLDKESFLFVLQQIPDLELDLFATTENHQLPLYVALNQDPLVVGVDVMVLDWNQWESIYIFPPFNMMMAVINNLRTFKGKAAIVAPLWQNSNWFH